MSLELALEKNTAAIERLIAALTTAPAENTPAIAATPAEIEQPDPPKTKRAKKEAAPEVGATGATGTTGTTGTNAAPPSPVASRDDVTAAVKAVLKARGPEATRKLLRSFGATKGSEVPDDRMGEFCTAAAVLSDVVPF